MPPPTALSLTESSSVYAVQFCHHLPDIEAFAEYVDIGPNETVLDLGTGLGWVLHELRKIQIQKHSRNTAGPFQPPAFIGVDASQSMLQVARALTTKKGDNYNRIRFVRDEMSTIRHVSDQVNVITCRDAFQHLPAGQRQVALDRWKSLLKPGGRMVFDFQGDTPIPCTKDIYHPRMRHPGSGMIHPTRAFFLPPEELEALETAFEALLAAAKLELVAGKTIRVAGINHHYQALCNDAHFASTGGGYNDDTETLELLCDWFRDAVGRDANLTQRCLLTKHFMEWVRDQATKKQPESSSRSPAWLRIKNLSLVAMVKVAEE